MNAERKKELQNNKTICMSFSRNDVLMIGTLIDWIASQHESEFDVFEEDLLQTGANIEGTRYLPGLIEKFSNPYHYGLDDEITDIVFSRDEAEYLGRKLAQAHEFGFDARPEYATLNFQYRFKTGSPLDIYKDFFDEFERNDFSSAT